MKQTLRHADLTTLVETLTEQDARKWDHVVPPSKMRMQKGRLRIETGTSAGNLDLVVNHHCSRQLANKLGIPFDYYERMRANHLDLLDANVNGWIEKEPKNRLVRAFTPNGDEGVARSILGDRYRIVDHLPTLIAGLEAIKEAGIRVEIQNADLTESRMIVRLFSPDVLARAPELLKAYSAARMIPVPLSRTHQVREWDADKDVIAAGFELSNSETGEGALTLQPRLLVRWCYNGAIINVDALRRAHLGAKMDSGDVRWSQSTHRKNHDLVVSQVKDAVTQFLSPDYLQEQVDRFREKGTRELDKPVAAVEQICKDVRITDEQTKSILDHFVRQGDPTPFGVMQAVTAQAKSADTGDDQRDLESLAGKVFDAAVRHASRDLEAVLEATTAA